MKFFNKIVDKRLIKIYTDLVSHYRPIEERGLLMSVKIENFDLNSLLGGINVIANVLLIGKSANMEEIVENSNTVNLYASLVEITEQYASTLLRQGGQFELEQEDKKKEILRAVSGL